MSLLKNFLSKESFWIINKRIAEDVGIEATLLLTFLIDKKTYWEGLNSLVSFEGESYFYATSKLIEEETVLTYRNQKTCIEKLIEKSLIKSKVMSTPAKTHFCICEQNIIDLMKKDSDKTKNKYLQNVNSSFNETSILELTKQQNINKELILKTNINFFIFKEGIKIFQRDLTERYPYEKENFIMFLDNSEVFHGKIIVPEIFLLDFLTELHPVRLEGMLRLFDGRIEERKDQFLKITKILFKERSSSTFEDIDHFINTVRKVNKDFEFAKKFKTQNSSTQKKITHVAGQENLF